jgi:hypothetical protein
MPKSTIQPNRLTERADNIRYEIEQLQAKLAAVESIPEDVYDTGAVVIFLKRFNEGGLTYTYAAVKGGGFWYLTGSPQRYTWNTLTDKLYGDIGSGGSIHAFFAEEIVEI